jgi:hypothetical protein
MLTASELYLTLSKLFWEDKKYEKETDCVPPWANQQLLISIPGEPYARVVKELYYHTWVYADAFNHNRRLIFRPGEYDKDTKQGRGK